MGVNSSSFSAKTNRRSSCDRHAASRLVHRVEQVAPRERPAPRGQVEQRERELGRGARPFDDPRRVGDPGLQRLEPPQVEHHPVARVVGGLGVGAVRERGDDLPGRLADLHGADPGHERAEAPVVRDPPRGEAEVGEEALDRLDVGRHALQAGQRAGGGGARVEHADDGRDVVHVGPGEQPGLEQAPVPGGRGPGEQQDEEVALGQAVLDLPVPVGPGRDVDAGDEALDLGAQRLERLLEGDGERVVLVLVADEDPEAIVG